MQVIEVLLKDWRVQLSWHVQHCCINDRVESEHWVPSEKEVACGWCQRLKKFSPFYNSFRLGTCVLRKSEFVEYWLRAVGTPRVPELSCCLVDLLLKTDCFLGSQLLPGRGPGHCARDHAVWRLRLLLLLRHVLRVLQCWLLRWDTPPIRWGCRWC